MASNTTRIFFAGGGTAGHLFPGLAVADRLTEMLPDAQITFVGSGKRMERGHVMSAGFDYLALPCRPAPRRLGELLSSFIENYAGYRTALRVLEEDGASLVVGLGGYASVPMARAAVRRNVPLVLLEQNAFPGRATRWLAPSAVMVCTAFEEIRLALAPKCRLLLTGNPLRREFEHCCPSDPAAKRQVVVLGGSQGARSLNENVPRAFYKLRAQLDGWQIVHQAGEDGLSTTVELYQKLGLQARVVSFLDDMPLTLATSGLAICRAGGTTLAELAATGVPAVLVPYPHATDDHQQKNAEVLAAVGASLVVDERWASSRLDEHLAQAIAQLLTSPDKRRQMSVAMARWSRPNAARDVAAFLRELIVTRSLGARASS